VGEGIIGQTSPANKYFAYGIRNSFGLDFDPVTGKLWDTENGCKWQWIIYKFPLSRNSRLSYESFISFKVKQD
jgi:hypothetical protein